MQGCFKNFIMLETRPMESIVPITHSEGLAESFVITAIATYADVDLCFVVKDTAALTRAKNEIETYKKILARKELFNPDLIQNIIHSCNLPRAEIQEFNLCTFPSFETPLYSEIVVEDDVLKERVSTLFTLLENPQRKIVITTLEAISFKTIPKETFRSFTDLIIIKNTLDREKCIENMINAGYERCDGVEKVGEFSIRGGIIDIFSPLYENPIRVELIGDEVHSLRFFNVDTQKSLATIDEVYIAPASEIILSTLNYDTIYKKLKELADTYTIPKKLRDLLFEKLQEKMLFPGIHYYVPLFYEKSTSFFEYFLNSRRKSFFVYNETVSLESLGEQFFETVKEHYTNELLTERMILPPEEVFLTQKECMQRFNESSFVNLKNEAFHTALSLSAKNNQWIRSSFQEHMERHDEPIRFLAEYLRDLQEKSFAIFIVSKDRLQEERFKELLKPYFLEGFFTVHFIIGFLHEGFFTENMRLLILADSDVFGERFTKHAKKPRESSKAIVVPSEGDYVVHVDHGIGKYIGLTTLAYEGFKTDCMVIQYAGSDKLYLPVDRLNLVQKYVGGDTAKIQLDRFGSLQWKQKTQKAQKAIDEIAGSLLRLYADREAHEGFAFSSQHREAFLEFESSFPFEETEDQINAINDVVEDMESSKPMDRLICGDVGYGKTEVALRASYKAILDGKQVAFLVPTTVLAFQHFNTLSRRYKDYPVVIESLSRFKSRTEQKEILSRLKEGKVDVVVGTHRLLQKDVAFKDLGLFIVDEEHKFGVKDKEAMKRLKVTVDVLTLTATPIPRTLQMSLFKIRDFSLMKTPPVDRLSIKTYIATFRDELIKEAIGNELKRGGQIYFVHNRVETIYSIASYLKRLMPGIRFIIGHGQMSERELESVMMAFINHEADVLICTTIIESGLDIPNANTIIINRADTFGLASLYQLRGRVGRSERQAYAYLLIPEREVMSSESTKRLGALRKFSELGSGFNLAMTDLEIRGGGEILGKSQSGHISAIGYELYLELLAKTIKRLKQENVDESVEPVLKIKMEAFIPPSYISNSQKRLHVYKRLSVCHEDHEVDAIKEELIDRFGQLPLAGEHFLEVIKIKLCARQWRIQEIEIHETHIICTFDERTHVKPEKLIELLKKDKKGILRFVQKENRLSILVKQDQRLEDFKKVLNQLG